jgi:hypothetical protein
MAFDEDSLEKLRLKIPRVENILETQTVRNTARIYYESLKLSYLKLKHKKDICKSRRKELITLGRSEITEIFRLLDYFHRFDCCERFSNSSPLASCYHPNFSEDEAVRYCNTFIVGTCKDKFGFDVRFPKEFYMSLYKSEGMTHRTAAQYVENIQMSRVKRLPMAKFTVEKTKCVLERIDEFNNKERMYVHRYVDYCDKTFYVIVIAEKKSKDTVSPFVVKTAFPVFDHNQLLRKIEKYTIPQPIK